MIYTKNKIHIVKHANCPILNLFLFLSSTSLIAALIRRSNIVIEMGIDTATADFYIFVFILYIMLTGKIASSYILVGNNWHTRLLQWLSDTQTILCLRRQSRDWTRPNSIGKNPSYHSIPRYAYRYSHTWYIIHVYRLHCHTIWAYSVYVI